MSGSQALSSWRKESGGADRILKNRTVQAAAVREGALDPDLRGRHPGGRTMEPSPNISVQTVKRMAFQDRERPGQKLGGSLHSRQEASRSLLTAQGEGKQSTGQ